MIAAPVPDMVGKLSPSTVESRFRKALLIASLLTALALCAYFCTMLWAQNELSPPESVVAAQSLMLIHDGTLYYDLNHYPFTVCAYTPVFYFFEAGLTRLGLPVFAAGRLISFAALLGLIVLCGKLAKRYADSPYAAWCARLFAASSPLLLNWGTIAQVDTLAYFLALASFYQYSLFEVTVGRTPGRSAGWARLAAALILAVLAMFTKQTTVAAPTTISLLLFKRSWKKGLAFGIVWVGIVATIAFSLNFATGGRFLADTVFANMNPMSDKKLLAQLIQLGSMSGGLLAIVGLAFRKIRQTHADDLLCYLLVAAVVFCGTAPKIGSDTNYQIEMTALLAVCAAVALHKLNFFQLYFAGSKRAVTLLLLPAAVHLVVGYRVAPNLVLFRVALEHAHTTQVAALRPYVPLKDGLVLSTDYNAMVRLRQRLDIEPLIYTLLVSSRKVDSTPVRRDIERGAFSTIFLGQDVMGGEVVRDPELGTLPEELLNEIRLHYCLAARLSNPLFGDSYVYRPIVASVSN